MLKICDLLQHIVDKNMKIVHSRQRKSPQLGLVKSASQRATINILLYVLSPASKEVVARFSLTHEGADSPRNLRTLSSFR